MTDMTTTPDLPAAHVDTPQQKTALRHNKSAALVRRMFPRGTRVEATKFFDQPGNGVLGTVVSHVPSMTADGGRLTVLWDDASPITGQRPWISDRVWAGGLLVVDPATGRGVVRESLGQFFDRQRAARNS